MADNQDILNPEERVEAYLRRWISAEEEIAFEEELRQNPDLMRLMEGQMEEMAQSQWIGMAQNAQQFDLMYEAAQFDWQQLRKLKIRNGVLIGVGVAAAITTAIIFNPFKQKKVEESPVPNQQEIFEQTYQAPLFIPQEAAGNGLSSEQLTLRAMVSRGDSAYASQDYSLAENRYSDIPIEFLSAYEQSRILLLNGVALLEIDKLEASKSRLLQAQNITLNAFAPYVEWYLSLIYLKAGQQDSTKILLENIRQNPLHPFYIQADSLDEKLDRLP